MEKFIKDRSDLIDEVNKKEIFIVYGDEKIPAKLSGKKMQFPVIYSPEYRHWHYEITWELVVRLYTGQVNCVVV